MPCEVFLTVSAARDIEELHGYVAANDSPKAAETLLGHIEKAIGDLSSFPERGAHPVELVRLGIKEYREVFYKPYRIIYRVIGNRVYVYLVADGRRDMQSLLERRMLGV